MLISHQSYLLHSLNKYIFYILKREREGLSSFNQLTTHVFLSTHRSYLQKLSAFLFLDMNTQSKLFIDVVCSDFPSKPERFYLHYNLLSTLYGTRHFLTCTTNELEKVPSLVSMYAASVWYEREVWDMFGVHFDGNYDLRRILTDYGFQGHPLRKDFPLSGFVELHYSERANSVVYEPISLVQEYRHFDTLSPWDWIPVN